MVLTGVCCFLGAVLLSVLVYVYCQKLRKPPQESAVIHPSTPNHLHYKDNSCAPRNDLYTPMEFKVSHHALGVSLYCFTEVVLNGWVSWY